MRLLQDAGYDVGYMGKDEACCGIPMKVVGQVGPVRGDLRAQRRRGAQARRQDDRDLVPRVRARVEGDLRRTSPPSAARSTSSRSSTTRSSSPRRIADGRLELDTRSVRGQTVTFHDSCHMGRAQGIYEPPRDMLKAIPGVELVEMEHNREEGLCCGSVLTLIGETPVAPILGGHRLQEAVDAGADTSWRCARAARCSCATQQHQERAWTAGRRPGARRRRGRRLRHPREHRVLAVHVGLLRQVHRPHAAREHGAVHGADLPADDGRDARRA